jgi:predicted nucleic acid-binding protein
VRFWDSSAIIALLVTQIDSERRRALYQEDGRVAAWWGSRVECISALHRLRREGALEPSPSTQALANLDSFFSASNEVAPTEEVRKRAVRLLRLHPLRAADALQLAAALVASGEEPLSLPLVCSDRRLKAAAEGEGFTVL